MRAYSSLLLAFGFISPLITFAMPGQSHPSDFFIQESSAGLLPINLPRIPMSAAGDCNERIKAILCLVEPKEQGKARECLPGGEVYAPVFEQIHDQLPPVLQKMFCSLDVIYIEKHFGGTAYAGGAKDGGAAVMGIRKSVLDENLNLNTWASWKEQLSFGGVKDSYTVSPTLPAIRTNESSGVNSFIYFLIAHEFGHFLDFANEVNSVVDSCPKDTEDDAPPVECDFKAGTWGSLSWATTLHPKPDADFANRDGLCFYWCNEKALNPSVIPQVYEDLLMKSPFISTYASTNAWDDFADSLAYYAMDRYLKTTYHIDTRQGAQYDIMAKLKSPLFHEKNEYLERFMDRTDLKYP